MVGGKHWPENLFAVGVQGDNVVILKPKTRLTKDEALNLAAWLVVLSRFDFEKEFLPLLHKVENS